MLPVPAAEQMIQRGTASKVGPLTCTTAPLFYTRLKNCLLGVRLKGFERFAGQGVSRNYTNLM